MLTLEVKYLYSTGILLEKLDTNWHKLQQKQTHLILFPECVLIDRKKVLRNPCGEGGEKPQSFLSYLVS